VAGLVVRLIWQLLNLGGAGLTILLAVRIWRRRQEESRTKKVLAIIAVLAIAVAGLDVGVVTTGAATTTIYAIFAMMIWMPAVVGILISPPMKGWIRKSVIISAAALLLGANLSVLAVYQRVILARQRYGIRTFRVIDLMQTEEVRVEESNSRNFIQKRFTISGRQPAKLHIEEGIGEPVDMLLSRRELADFDQELADHRADESDDDCPCKTKLELHWTLAKGSFGEETQWVCAGTAIEALFARGESLAKIANRKAREQRKALEAQEELIVTPK
jgi:hypothetical protein